MKVQELISALETQNPDTEVRLFDEDDYCVEVRTVLQAMEGYLVITQKRPTDYEHADFMQYKEKDDNVVIWEAPYGQ